MAADAGSPAGAAMVSGGPAATRAEGAASECHRPKYREENTKIRIKAPTASPHKSIGLCTSALREMLPNIADNHDNLENGPMVLTVRQGGCLSMTIFPLALMLYVICDNSIRSWASSSRMGSTEMIASTSTGSF